MKFLIWGAGKCPLIQTLVRHWQEQELGSDDFMFLTDDDNHRRDGNCYEDLTEFFHNHVQPPNLVHKMAIRVPPISLWYDNDEQWEALWDVVGQSGNLTKVVLVGRERINDYDHKYCEEEVRTFFGRVRDKMLTNSQFIYLVPDSIPSGMESDLKLPHRTTMICRRWGRDPMLLLPQLEQLFWVNRIPDG